MTGIAAMRLVARREIVERLRSRLIWVMTALTTLLVVALIVIPSLVRQPATPTVVGLVGASAQALGPALRATARAANVDITTVDVATDAAARSRLQKGSLDVALIVGTDSAVAEVQFASLPITLPIVAGFLLTYLTIAAPGALWLRLLSFLPPLAPILMPARLALGSLAWWEMPVAVLITVVAVYGMMRLAARIYAPALVRGGARLTWSAALRLGEE